MRLTLLGTGGPRPDPDRLGPANLVQVGDLDLVFDAGRGVAWRLAQAGVAVETIDAVFITHLHFDHIGGLGDLLMAGWNNGRTAPLPIYGPPGISAIVEAMLADVYSRDIAYRVAEEQAMGVDLAPPAVAVHELRHGQVELGSGVMVTVGEVEHGQAALDLDPQAWTALGYRIAAGERQIAISGDAVAGRELGRLATGVDVLVMCAYLSADEITSPTETFLVDHVIAGAPQAAEIARRAGVDTLILTHIREKSDDEIELMRSQIAEVFPGSVIVASDTMSIEV